MKLPRINDEMFERIAAVHKSPLLVLFTVADDGESDAARWVCGQAMDSFDSRVIFLEVMVDEHPTLSLNLLTAAPCVLLKRGSDTDWRRIRPVTARAVDDALHQVCA